MQAECHEKKKTRPRLTQRRRQGTLAPDNEKGSADQNPKTRKIISAKSPQKGLQPNRRQQVTDLLAHLSRHGYRVVYAVSEDRPEVLLVVRSIDQHSSA